MGETKPSQFLRSLEPFSIYDHIELAMDFAKEVGDKPPWPAHSSKRAQLDVMLRSGKDAWMNTSEPLAPVAYGYEVAESVALQVLPEFEVEGDDLAQRFEAAVLCLEEIGK